MNGNPSPDSNTNPHQRLSPQAQRQALVDTTNQPMQNYDGTEMRDSQSRLVYKSQFLSTHPLRGDCKEKPGFGGKRFTYVTGDGVIRTMNAIFGHGGWSSQIISEKLIQSEKDDRGRWIVGYLVTVRITLLNGSSHEDCGSGEGINPSKIQAHDKALKSAVTDAMKRAARHFGERLGNALYVKGNGIKTAPRTNWEALVSLERGDALNLFGDQVALREKCSEAVDNGKQNGSLVGGSGNSAMANTGAVSSMQTVNQATPVVSTAVGRLSIGHNNTMASLPANQPPTPVVSAAPRQQANFNSGTSISTIAHQHATNLPTVTTAASMPPNQYVSNGQRTAPPAAAHSNLQGLNPTTNSTSINSNCNRWKNTGNQNQSTMPPPPLAARGISPENTSGSSVPDASKRSLNNIPVRHSLGNSANQEDSNKRQKRNPYSNNNRLSS